MSKVDIFSGFLGAGKTTLIKKLVKEAYSNEKIVIIENEFGEIGIDGGFLQEAGIEITEMNSGCICCSLVGDFSKALTKVVEEYNPDRIIIEPSGVGKLSDVTKAVMDIESDKLEISSLVAVADAHRCKMYIKNFGEFYRNQIENAGTVILSHTDNISEAKLEECLKLLREINSEVEIITTPWDQLTGEQILDAIYKKDTLKAELETLAKSEHHHHHHDHDECCNHEHHHHDHDGCCNHEHHHHDHDECCNHEHHHDHSGCCCHEHHHHDHDHNCDCGCGGHDHHHADEIFDSWGLETAKKFSKDYISSALEKLSDEDSYGIIVRAKGIVPSDDGEWIHFDYIPGSIDIRTGAASTIGRLCVIGSKIDKEKIATLFDA